MKNGLNDSEHQQLGRFVEELRRETSAFPAGAFSGRGIVICAGGARIFTNAYILIRLLREVLGCSLPVEVWHFGTQEISPAMAAMLDHLGVSRVDALPLIDEKNARIHDGWQLKAFALLWSRFSEVLLLDADQVPVVDPATVFDWPEYRDNGAVFWPDIVDIRADNPVWSIFGLERAQRVSVESGQLLVDKSRHWRALVTALRLNERADLLYQLVYGDKDTFLLAWMFCDAACAMVPHRPYIDERYLVQRDFGGRPLFQHRTNAKWSYAGEQLRFPAFTHEAACLSFLDDLRRVWGGRVFNAPDRSLDARQVETELIERSPFVLEIGDDQRDTLELRPYGEIGSGRAYDRQNWWVEHVGDEYRLVISDSDSRTYQLHRQNGDYWLGYRLAAPQSQAVLKAKASSEPRGDAPRPTTLVDQLLDASGILHLAETPAALVEAMVLLSRVVPGLQDDLRRRAAEAPDQNLAMRLAALADAVAIRNHKNAKAFGDDTLASGYVFSGNGESR